MQINQQVIGKHLQIALHGRLDATWSEYVKDFCLNQIRCGHHHLMIDAENLSFLSSAGIRVLLITSKELLKVQGSLTILNASPFVGKTLQMTGLGEWLITGSSAGKSSGSSTMSLSETQSNLLQEDTPLVDGTVVYGIDPHAEMHLEIPAGWHPWQNLQEQNLSLHPFPANSVAIGIGSALETTADALNSLGEFLAVSGNVVFATPGNNQRPDYLLCQEEYVPEMHVVQLIKCSGGMSHHFRFSPSRSQESFGIGTLAKTALRMVKGKMAVVVLLAEIHGLVGASLIRSPGEIKQQEVGAFPEIREWITFSGEPVYKLHQSIVCGIISEDPGAGNSLLKPLPSQPGLWGHFHAAVFPFQPLPNGELDMDISIARFFHGPPPIEVMHLIDDQRPVNGIGESTFIRGAAWCAPVKYREDVA